MKKSKEKNQNDLHFCRLQIDRIDSEIAQLLIQRFELAKTIGEIKREIKEPIINNGREKALIDGLIAQHPDLNEKFIKELYSLIFQESRKRQKK